MKTHPWSVQGMISRNFAEYLGTDAPVNSAHSSGQFRSLGDGAYQKRCIGSSEGTHDVARLVDSSSRGVSHPID